MKIRIALAVALCLGLAGSLAGQQPGASRPNVVTGRSKVATKYGIVAASQPLAARAGVQILERGGNAVDAAIATNAVMALVEPHNNGIGGDVFAIYYEAKSGKLYGLNAGGWAPSGLTPALLRVEGPRRGCRTAASTRVTVPGAVKGWEMLRARFGRLPMSDLLAPAIFYAEDGFPVTDVIADAWDGATKKLAADPHAAKTFLIGGRAPRAGEVFKNPHPGRHDAAHRREGAGRLLRGQDRRGDSRRLAREGRHDDRRGPEGVPAGVGRADLDDLSRVDRLRAAAEHAGHRRADDAEPDGTVPARRVRAHTARRRCT